MKITDLNEFNFYIGNTTSENGEYGEDIAATNEGIEGDCGVIAEYDEEMDINDEDDLMELIDDAIAKCEYFSEEDRGELGTYLGADIDIKDWWKKNYDK